jgi:hypothetical protein
MFERNLVGKERVIIYTKRDLGASSLDDKVCQTSFLLHELTIESLQYP